MVTKGRVGFLLPPIPIRRRRKTTELRIYTIVGLKLVINTDTIMTRVLNFKDFGTPKILI